MIDIEKAIAKRIALAQKYITPHNNAVIVKKNETEIRILRTTPRDEQALERMIKRKLDQIAKITSVNQAEPLHYELEALEWLLPIIKLKDTNKTENDFV
jgi:hypothetical protein